MTQPPPHRSHQIEADRLRNLLSRLPPEKLEPTYQKAAKKVLTGSDIWKNGVEPMAFDQFCHALDDQALWPRQVVPFEAANLLRATSLLDPTRTDTEGCFVWGKRGGKDMTIGKLAVYTPYVLSQMRGDPCTVMAQISGRSIGAASRLDCPNIAPTADLAIEVFFNYVKGYLASPLFRDIEIYPKPEKMMPGTDHIIFPNIDLHLYSKSSDASGLDGYNVFRYFIDEGDEFASNGAVRLRKIFRRTMLSTFGPFGLGISFSYPRYEDGFILNLRKEMQEQLARHDEPPLFFVDFAPTHEIRPDFDLDSPEIAHEFRVDPAGASAMFLNEPMAVGDAFFPYKEKIQEAIDPNRKPSVVFSDHIVEVIREDGSVILRKGARIESIRPTHGVATFLGGDGGETKDSFALSCWSVEQHGAVAEYLCPLHGANAAIRAYAPYEECAKGTISTTATRCGICACSPFDFHPMGLLRGWWSVGRAAGLYEIPIGPDGAKEMVALPMIYQEFLYQFKPVPPGPHRKAVVVDYTTEYGAYQVAAKICRELKVRQARFDPYNTPSIVQGLQDSSIDADKIMFTNPAQWARALLCRILLHNNRLVMLPDPYADDPDGLGRDVQWRRLQRKGTIGVDHPKGGAKDLYDADAIAIWCAALYVQPKLEMLIMGSESMR